MTDDLVIRPARSADAASLERLGALDVATSFGRRLAALARSPRPSTVLVAESDGGLVAALDLSKGHLVADPFKRAVEARRLLEERYLQLQQAAAHSSRPRRRWIARRSTRTG